jgi:hypothetical protein
MIEFDINFVAAPDLLLEVGEDEEGWERLDLWQPTDKMMVCIAIRLCVGMVGMVGTNDFSLEICTRPYIASKGHQWKLQYVLVVDEFDWPAIKAMIRARIEACRRDDWDSSVEELRKHFYWEYETTRATVKKLKPLPARVIPKIPKNWWKDKR